MSNFIGTFNLKNQNDKQFIYSSQLYGTFFNVYAQPILDENEEKLMQLRLLLINYKGELNMGLMKAENESQDIELINGKITFKIHVKALEEINGDSKSVTLNFKGININEIKEWEIYRELHAIADNNSKQESSISAQIFDSEFFERDGTYFGPRLNPENKKSPGLRCKTSNIKVISL